MVVRSFFNIDEDDGRSDRLEQQTVTADLDGPGTSVNPPRAKFVNFSSPTTAKLVEKLSSVRQEYDLSNGKKLTIIPLTNELIDPTADTLTEAFGDAMGYLNTYQTFLRNQIVLTDAAETRVDGDETDETEDNNDSAVLVGTCELSFHPSTRSKHLTLNSPPDMPYLCNMAVREEHKGKGYGSMLLDAAERVVLSTGYKSLYLHVRHVDAPALGLYRKYGYEPDGEDIGLVRLIGLDQRYLMKKYLNPS